MRQTPLSSAIRWPWRRRQSPAPAATEVGIRCGYSSRVCSLVRGSVARFSCRHTRSGESQPAVHMIRVQCSRPPSATTPSLVGFASKFWIESRRTPGHRKTGRPPGRAVFRAGWGGLQRPCMVFAKIRARSGSWGGSRANLGWGVVGEGQCSNECRGRGNVPDDLRELRAYRKTRLTTASRSGVYPGPASGGRIPGYSDISNSHFYPNILRNLYSRDGAFWGAFYG